MTAGRPLGRFSVVDLTTVRSGPTCTKILADFGARVLRVERPGGEGRERVFYDGAAIETLLAEGVIQEHHGGRA